MEEVEFVITAPDEFATIIAYDNGVRQTHGVLIDMFLQAKKSIVLGAPYFKDLSMANPNLNRALIEALRRGVDLNLVSTSATFESINLDQYQKFNVSLFVPKANSQNESFIGSHAKFCIVDGLSVYLGSANFTFLGLNKNFEMGVYSNGKIATQVDAFWRYLCNRGYFVVHSLNS